MKLDELTVFEWGALAGALAGAAQSGLLEELALAQAPLATAALAGRTGADAAAVEHVLDLGHHVLAVGDHDAVRRCAQGSVQGRAVFGDVDDCPGEHGVAARLQVALASQREQVFQGVVVDAVLGIVQAPAGSVRRVTLGTCG